MTDSLESLSDEEILQINEQIPSEILKLISDVEQAGFNLTLVGGAVRDFILFGKVSKDLDFELRHQFEFEGAQWSSRLDDLGKKLIQNYGYQVEFLSFSIMRIVFSTNDWDVEIGSARLESFNEQESYGHSDVEVSLVSNGDYQDTFKRRDFSFNAIGIEFDPDKGSMKWVDPYEGRQSLVDKVMLTPNPDFTKDPVRFCRMIRFSLKFDLEFSSDLESLIGDFDLNKLSSFYFFREAAKVGYFPFFMRFFELIKKHGVPLGAELSRYGFLALPTNEKPKDRKALIEILINDCFPAKITKDQIVGLATDIGVKSVVVKGLIALKENLSDLSQFDLGVLKSEIGMGFDNFRAYGLLAPLKKLHQLMHQSDLSDFLAGPKFKVYRELLPKELLGKDIFLSKLKEHEVTPQSRGDLQYFCHFQVYLRDIDG